MAGLKMKMMLVVLTDPLLMRLTLIVTICIKRKPTSSIVVSDYLSGYPS